MKNLILALTLTIGAPVVAAAHGSAHGPHGGAVVEFSGHHVEFVATGDEVMFYLTDESEKPIASTGATGSAIVQQGGKSRTITLEPAAPNILKGHMTDPIAVGARIVVSGKMSDGHAIQARFVKK